MVESGQRSLRLEGAAAAAQALGVSLDYLAGLTDNPAPAARRSVDPALAPGDVPGARPVPVRELAAAAGGGAVDLDETIVGYLYFRLDWLDQHALEPSQCDVIRVSGESMDPTLPDGCSILVDRSRRAAFAFGGAENSARIAFPGDQRAHEDVRVKNDPHERRRPLRRRRSEPTRTARVCCGPRSLRPSPRRFFDVPRDLRTSTGRRSFRLSAPNSFARGDPCRQ